ncbi:MAG: DUF3990 domain-containing protein [Muribaculaceae bacterium]|nr:DUF3990 domain-containing protein [Muribaculaceae bacterium]
MNLVEVYHASIFRIEKPLWDRGRSNLDFGKGFYLTDIYDQALVWALRKGRENNTPPIINSYIFNKREVLEKARCLIFETYDNEWLDFIVSCRSGGDIWKQYDYIEGGVADDRVIDTVNLYIQGFISAERAIDNLKYFRPNNQICINNQEILDSYLKFQEELKLPENELL